MSRPGSSSSTSVDVVRPETASTVTATLQSAKEQLRRAEEELIEYRRRERPLREAVDVLRRAVRELSGGELSSDQWSDDEIVQAIIENASAKTRLSSRSIAKLFGRPNAKGFSRRLRRMADEGQIAGNSVEGGYYVPGFDHGRRVRVNPQPH